MRTSLIPSIILALAFGTIAQAQDTPRGGPSWQGYNWADLGSVPLATDLAFLPNGNILTAQKGGIVRAWSPTGTALGVVLDISAEVHSNGEGGMNSMLLDPDFASNGFMYLYYAVDPLPGTPDTVSERYGRITRYTLDSSANWLTVVPASEHVLLGANWSEGVLLEGINHLTGDMQWGEDGTLLFSAGDSSTNLTYSPSGNANYGPGRFDSALDIGSLRAAYLPCYNGKISRIDRATGLGLPSNPFWTGDGNDPASRVWAYGMRNPYRFCVRLGTGTANPADGQPGVLWIGDVGLDTYEELNVTSPGGGNNFGWPFFEGPAVGFPEGTYAGPLPYPDVNSLTEFVFATSHDTSLNPSVPAELVGSLTGGAIIGGIFYDFERAATGSPAFPYSPLVRGKYVFHDWANLNTFFMTVPENSSEPEALQELQTGESGPTITFGINAMRINPHDGKIYAVNFFRLLRMDIDPAFVPAASVTPTWSELE